MPGRDYSVDQLAGLIEQALSDYSAEVTRATKAEVAQIAKDCAAEISERAPKRSGDYARSWTERTTREDSFGVTHTVYSKKYYPLTHLLEYGHDKWVFGHETAGFVQPKPHIRPAMERAQERLVNGIKARLR